jgi:hypothetical protein
MIYNLPDKSYAPELVNKLVRAEYDYRVWLNNYLPILNTYKGLRVSTGGTYRPTANPKKPTAHSDREAVDITVYTGTAVYHLYLFWVFIYFNIDIYNIKCALLAQRPGNFHIHFDDWSRRPDRLYGSEEIDGNTVLRPNDNRILNWAKLYGVPKEYLADFIDKSKFK